MKAYMMFRDRDFDAQAKLPDNADALMQDLELGILLEAMAGNDKFIYEISKTALLTSLFSIEEITYRQAMLADCLENRSIIRQLYAIATEAIESKRRNWYGIYTVYPSAVLHSAAHMIEMYIPFLVRLRRIADNSSTFTSEGFTRFFAMIRNDLDDEYFQVLQDHIKYVEFKTRVLISATLGEGLESQNHRLRKSNNFGRNWLRRVFSPRVPSYSFSISSRDETGARALGELKDRGLNVGANALAQAADHIESFFKLLLAEIAFYVGCLNLKEHLESIGELTSFPTALPEGSLGNEFVELYNVCLSLHSGKRTVASDMRAQGKNPVIITGVNEGGKSTFLRSVGVAQLMMQCGMFVPAKAFSADIARGVFTHYRRKEDRSMQSGKFDEELTRMDAIVQQLHPHALMLFNESFAATNEREGAEIAMQITKALVEHGVRIFFVTHLYTFAAGFKTCPACHPLLLRAELRSEGNRTFKIVEGAPSQRSHGEFLYHQIFGDEKDLARVP